MMMAEPAIALLAMTISDRNQKPDPPSSRRVVTGATTRRLARPCFRIYTSDAISYLALVKASQHFYCQRADDAIALEAFSRLAIAAAAPDTK